MGGKAFRELRRKNEYAFSNMSHERRSHLIELVSVPPFSPRLPW